MLAKCLLSVCLFFGFISAPVYANSWNQPVAAARALDASRAAAPPDAVDRSATTVPRTFVLIGVSLLAVGVVGGRMLKV